MKSIVLGLVMFLFGFNAYSQTIGEKAPEIAIKKWMNGEPKLKGKKVFLEFWATWCGPCKKMIPHLNELNAKYGKDLIFVSVTKENPALIAEFMKKTEMKSFIAIDDDSKTNTNFGIKFIPQAFIINENGIVDWSGHPANLSDEAIDEYIKTGKIAQAQPQETPTADPQKNLLYALTISKTNFPQENGTYSLGSGEIQYINLSIKTIFEMILEATPSRLVLDDKITNSNIDIYYRPSIKQNYDQYKNIMLEDICKALNFQIIKEKKSVKLYKLTCTNPEAKAEEYNQLMKQSKELESKVEEKNQKWSANVVPVSLVVRFLESKFKSYFSDETNLKGYYNFNISSNSLAEATADLEKSGFAIKESQEEITIYKVEPIQK